MGKETDPQHIPSKSKHLGLTIIIVIRHIIAVVGSVVEDIKRRRAVVQPPKTTWSCTTKKRPDTWITWIMLFLGLSNIKTRLAACYHRHHLHQSHRHQRVHRFFDRLGLDSRSCWWRWSQSKWRRWKQTWLSSQWARVKDEIYHLQLSSNMENQWLNHPISILSIIRWFCYQKLWCSTPITKWYSHQFWRFNWSQQLPFQPATEPLQRLHAELWRPLVWLSATPPALLQLHLLWTVQPWHLRETGRQCRLDDMKGARKTSGLRA